MRGLPWALRHRDYALLWGGQTISVVGDGIYTVAGALEALRISDHASALAAVEAARVAPNAEPDRRVVLPRAGARGRDRRRGGSLSGIRHRRRDLRRQRAVPAGDGPCPRAGPVGTVRRGRRPPGHPLDDAPALALVHVLRAHLREPPVGRAHADRGAGPHARARLLGRLAVLDLPVAAGPPVRGRARGIDRRARHGAGRRRAVRPVVPGRLRARGPGPRGG